MTVDCGCGQPTPGTIVAKPDDIQLMFPDTVDEQRIQALWAELRDLGLVAVVFDPWPWMRS